MSTKIRSVPHSSPFPRLPDSNLLPVPQRLLYYLLGTIPLALGNLREIPAMTLKTNMITHALINGQIVLRTTKNNIINKTLKNTIPDPEPKLTRPPTAYHNTTRRITLANKNTTTKQNQGTPENTVFLS